MAWYSIERVAFLGNVNTTLLVFHAETLKEYNDFWRNGCAIKLFIEAYSETNAKDFVVFFVLNLRLIYGRIAFTHPFDFMPHDFKANMRSVRYLW